MTDATFDFSFDTSKPIFILEVINQISEAAKAQIDRLQNAFKKRAQHMKEVMSSLSKLGKSSKNKQYATAQSDAYESVQSPNEIASRVAISQRKNDLNGKNGGSSRSH